MVERLSEEERESIKKNWSSIKSCGNETKEIKIDDWTFGAFKMDTNIRLSFNKKGNKKKSIIISENAKLIKFKYQKENKLIEKEELIYQPSSIIHFVKFYQMEHPIYKIQKDKEILDISITEENVKDILNNPNITEIIDDRFCNYISSEEFLKDNNKNVGALDNYDNYSLDIDSNLANVITKKTEKKYIESKDRKELTEFFDDLNLVNKKIVVLAAAQKIGISYTILRIIECYSILYIDINVMFHLKNSDKRKYVFHRFINLFVDYEKYQKFITQNILPLNGYDNILIIIKKIISSIAREMNNINIIIDNYDDHLVGELKLNSDYIDSIFELIKDKNIKIMFIGRGLYISKLLIKFFFEKTTIKNYILFKYYSTLNLGIENIIHSYNNEKDINEIELYYNCKNDNNMEYFIYNMIIIKNMKKILEKNYNQEIPFQFFKIKLNNKNELQIDYQFDDLIDLNNIKLREYMAKLSSFIHIIDNSTPSVKGFIFEELIVSLLMNNKSGLSNLNFSKNNIITVDSIYGLSNVEKVSNLENGSILIIQKKNGEVLDFGIIINHNNINYFIGGQIGLNKTKENIVTYIQKMRAKNEIIIKNLSNLTNRDITKYKFFIILNKERQNSLEKEYMKLNDEITQFKEKIKNKIKLSEFETYTLNKMRNKVNHFSSEYGIKSCENENISYLLFSIEDLCFYEGTKKINFFDIDQIKFLKTGIEAFCDKEFHLQPYNFKDEILNEKEKYELLSKIKECISSEIEDIKIENKIVGNINLLPATPKDYGILSINNEIKLFTYFSDKYTHFLISKNKVYKYDHSEKLFDNKFENYDEYLQRYFVEFIYENYHEIDIEEEKTPKKKSKLKKKGKGKKGKNKKSNQKELKKENEEEEYDYEENEEINKKKIKKI